MCIIVYKPQNVEFPKEEIIKRCFAKNSDGAGYMFAYKGEVYIRKGFMNYESFAKDLAEARKVVGDKCAFVLHFRISTQGGVKQGLCHPYPLSKDYDEMRKLDNKCKIAVAHNGIISLTSTRDYGGGYWDSKAQKWVTTTIDHNDTMEFIKEYLSLIVINRDYYKYSNKTALIKKLIGNSRLAILDGEQHCELIGDWIKDNGIYYSNSGYKEVEYSYSKTPYTYGSYQTPSKSSTKGTSKDWGLVEDADVEYFMSLYGSFVEGYDNARLTFDFTPYGNNSKYSEVSCWDCNGFLIAEMCTDKDLKTEREVAQEMDDNIDEVDFDDEMYDVVEYEERINDKGEENEPEDEEEYEVIDASEEELEDCEEISDEEIFGGKSYV